MLCLGMAARLAYYFFFSLFPTLLVMLSGPSSPCNHIMLLL